MNVSRTVTVVRAGRGTQQRTRFTVGTLLDYSHSSTGSCRSRKPCISTYVKGTTGIVYRRSELLLYLVHHKMREEQQWPNLHSYTIIHSNVALAWPSTTAAARSVRSRDDAARTTTQIAVLYIVAVPIPRTWYIRTYISDSFVMVEHNATPAPHTPVLLDLGSCAHQYVHKFKNQVEFNMEIKRYLYFRTKWYYFTYFTYGSTSRKMDRQ